MNFVIPVKFKPIAIIIIPPVDVISIIKCFIKARGITRSIWVANIVIKPSYKITGIAENKTPIPSVVVNINATKCIYNSFCV